MSSLTFFALESKQEPAVGCPRQPWHDLHCRIDGPAAYDILTNFEERWLRASKQSGLQRLKSSYDDQLLRFERIPEFISIAEISARGENNPETWNVQVCFCLSHSGTSTFFSGASFILFFISNG